MENVICTGCELAIITVAVQIRKQSSRVVGLGFSVS